MDYLLSLKKFSMKNKIKIIVTLLAGMFLLNSCLKDDVGDYWNDDVAGKMYATIPVNTLQQKALQPVAGDVPFSFMLNIATDALPTEDIIVTLDTDPSAVTAYNAAKGKDYKPFPNVELASKTITITKGTRTATVTGKVWGAEALNACDNFIAPISIMSAKTASGKDIPVAGNMKSYLLALPIANPYAGTYACEGYRIRPGNATEPVSQDEVVSTVDCKTVRKSGFGNYSVFDVLIEITTDPVVVQGTTCYKVKCTVLDPGSGDAVVGGMWPEWTGDASKKPADLTINYYNPVTKTFILNCYYESSAGNRIMYEVLTRK